MINKNRPSFSFSGIAIAALVTIVLSTPVLADVDLFQVRHVSAPCTPEPFTQVLQDFQSIQRIHIVSGEKIVVTLIGDMADYAISDDGDNIHEFIPEVGGRGHMDKPGANPMFGGMPQTGWVDVHIRADAQSDGLGDRTVNVYWLAGQESIPIKIVSNCAQVAGTYLRTKPVTNTGTVGPPLVGSGSTELRPGRRKRYILPPPIPPR